MGAAVFLVGLFPIDMLALAKQQCDAPDAGETDEGIDDPAEYRALAAKQPCHKVKLKNTDQTPVQAADDRKDQCYRIHNATSIHCLAMCRIPDTGRIMQSTCKILRYPVNYTKTPPEDN